MANMDGLRFRVRYNIALRIPVSIEDYNNACPPHWKQPAVYRGAWLLVYLQSGTAVFLGQELEPRNEFARCESECLQCAQAWRAPPRGRLQYW